jgi:hypothetical protein
LAVTPVRGIRHHVRIDVEWPFRREDVLFALDTLAAEPPDLQGDELDPRWPDLKNAVHWLVDDTWWDHNDPRESIGTMLRNEDEAIAVEKIVAMIVRVSERQGPTASNTKWFGDPDWPQVRTLAAQAATTLRA